MLSRRLSLVRSCRLRLGAVPAKQFSVSATRNNATSEISRQPSLTPESKVTLGHHRQAHYIDPKHAISRSPAYSTNSVDLEPARKKILGQLSSIDLVKVLSQCDPILSQKLFNFKENPAATKQFKAEFDQLLIQVIDRELFENLLGVQNLFTFLNQLRRTSLVAVADSAFTMRDSKIDPADNLFYKDLIAKVTDPLKSAILKYILYPTSTSTHKEIFKALVVEVFDTKIPNPEEVVFSFLDNIALLQDNLIKLDLLDYFNIQYRQYQHVLKDEAISDKIIENFKDESLQFFNQYKIMVMPELFKLLVNSLDRLDYPNLMTRLLDCNICLETTNISNELKRLTRYLLRDSSEENRSLISGVTWQKNLNALKFTPAFFERVNLFKKGAVKVSDMLINTEYPQTNFFIKPYFESKIVILYPIDLLCSIIMNKTKLHGAVTDSQTFKLISAISSQNPSEKDGNYAFLARLDKLEQANRTNLQDLMASLFKKYQIALERNSGDNYTSLVHRTRLVTKLLSVLMVYSMRSIGSESLIAILGKTIELNKELANLVNKVLSKKKGDIKDESIKQNVRTNYNYIILLLITGFRQKGLLDESLKLLNLLISLNCQNGNFQNKSFRYSSTVAKDLVTEFLLILKLNYPDNPKFLLSYMIEFSSNYSDMLRYNEHDPMAFEHKLTNKELLNYYANNPDLTTNKNAFSSFFILNKLGLVRLVYENTASEINLKSSQELSFYEDTLLRANILKDLKNLSFSNEALSICYATVFDHTMSTGVLTVPLLKKLFHNYIDLIINVQSKLPETSPHPLSKKKLSGAILSQFMNRALLLNDVETADEFLATFLKNVKVSRNCVSIDTFDKLIFKYSLISLDKGLSEMKAKTYYDKVVNLVRVMNEEFSYPVTFWTKFSMILLHYRDKNSEASYKWFLELTESGKDFSKLRHILLIKMARAREWPLPDYLRNVRFPEDDFFYKQLQDKDAFVPSAYINLNKEDILEFENDKLEDTYNDRGVKRDKYTLEEDLPTAEELKAVSFDYDGLDGKVFDEIYALLPKAKLQSASK